MLFEHDGDEVQVTTTDKPVRFLFVSGKPLGEPVAWYGPIVMNTQEELRVAFEEYEKGTFHQAQIDRRGGIVGYGCSVDFLVMVVIPQGRKHLGEGGSSEVNCCNPVVDEAIRDLDFLRFQSCNQLKHWTFIEAHAEVPSGGRDLLARGAALLFRFFHSFLAPWRRRKDSRPSRSRIG